LDRLTRTQIANDQQQAFERPDMTGTLISNVDGGTDQLEELQVR
jgi:hypothetical protein